MFDCYVRSALPIILTWKEGNGQCNMYNAKQRNHV